MRRLRILALIALVFTALAGITGSASELRVLTFNVWDVGFAGGSYNQERLRAICEEFREAAQSPEGWDVILIQELWPEKRRHAFDRCGYPYVADVENYRARYLTPHMALLKLFTGNSLDTGLRVLSRYPMESLDRLTYSKNGKFRHVARDGDWLARKSAMAVRVIHPTAGPFWVINTHLVSRNPKDNYGKQRALQFRELSAWVSQLAQDEPVIVGGDFNIGPPGKGPDPAISYDERIWNAIFTEYFPELQDAGGPDDPCTYCADSNTFVKTSEGWQKIDHLFVSSHFDVLSAKRALDSPKLIRTKKLKNRKDARFVVGNNGEQLILEVNLSDHFGWEATLWLN